MLAELKSQDFRLEPQFLEVLRLRTSATLLATPAFDDVTVKAKNGAHQSSKLTGGNDCSFPNLAKRSCANLGNNSSADRMHRQEGREFREQNR